MRNMTWTLNSEGRLIVTWRDHPGAALIPLLMRLLRRLIDKKHAA